MDPLSRRLLQAGLVGAGAAMALRLPGARGQPPAAPAIHPRSNWGADLPPRGPMEQERPEDVRFLLVHHSVSANDYPAEAVPEELRTFYRLHTSPEKGWPDLAYNFLVDRFGGIWEGRAGSIDAPVKGDATGGSQGFALLCCFIGDHRTLPPSPEAQASMVVLLAWLAARYGIDPRPGTTTSFVSRGSNRWPAGTPVTTTTIAGHRDMSRTVCPGDACYRLVRNDFPVRVATAMGLTAAPPPASDPAPAAATSSSTAVTSPPQPAQAVTTTTGTPPSATTALSTNAPRAAPESAGRLPPAERSARWPVPVAVGLAALTAVVAMRKRVPKS